jgi:hypothetical protein
MMALLTFPYGVGNNEEVSVVDCGETLVISAISGTVLVNRRDVMSLIGALHAAQNLANKLKEKK